MLYKYCVILYRLYYDLYRIVLDTDMFGRTIDRQHELYRRNMFTEPIFTARKTCFLSIKSKVTKLDKLRVFKIETISLLYINLLTLFVNKEYYELSNLIIEYLTNQGPHRETNL